MFDQDILIQAICDSTQEVFSTMLGLEIKAGPPSVDRTAPGPTDGVVSLIGLTGAWVGTGCISCGPGLACRICSHLLMSEPSLSPEAVDEEVLDAVAEVTNMIVGNVKTVLEEHLGQMGLSIPTVIFGRNFTTRTFGKDEWTVVPFFCAGERMDVKMCMVRAQNPQQPIRHGFPGPVTVHAKP